ncbi:SprT family zinc-dependent metalloprotease [Shewanella sp. AS16]|uniref:SprT family zinc-dependent metalloprotease n=1 Tax=Shewanella sp. AS16 TaxID=2907625 RepID=UPI001F21CDD4|nr:SprT family zinc-dependent metalloprotease [Shewanella sp. AS16]MCE9685798.1 SprT family zinc-dependent metalloprotease [Shewanella sp. AS16]
MLNSLRLLAGLGRVASPPSPQKKSRQKPRANKPLGHEAVPAELTAELEAKVDACYRLAEDTLQQSFPRPEISFALRGRSAGTAHLQQNRLRFNPVLLAENAQAFINEVVPHEICHLLCHRLYGRVKPHGREWQTMMLELFKQTPSTTHSFSTASVTPTGVSYLCDCGELKLSIRRHNKVLRGQSHYSCRRCGQRLQQARQG